jgi:mono/diheme cytochrome c family protein
MEELIRNGRAAMPPVGEGWNDQQLKAVIAYLQKEKPSGG